MGKRELMLAAAFLLIGIVVYQVTAPAADPSRPGWSVAGIVERMRREIRGNQAQASATNSATIRAPESVRELRVVVGSVNVTIVGESRDDIQADMAVTSNAYDAAEAERTAKESKLTVDETGSIITLGTYFPEAGRQRASIELKVPSRIEVRLEKNSTVNVTNVAALSVTGRGQTVAKSIIGPVHANQRGGVITLTDIGPLKLTTFSGTEARISNVRGDASLTLQGGELHAEQIDGSVEIEARNCEIKLEKLEKLRRQIRINATGGEVAVLGVQTELRIDGRETEIRVEQAGAATVSIYNEGNDTVELTVPPDGFKVDAMTIDGRLTVDDGLEKDGVKVTGTDGQGGQTGSGREEYRVEATVRGGGPLITIRARRGDIVLRSK